MSGMDGSRSGARRAAARKIKFDCPCGFTIYGNGKQHQRHCATYRRVHGYPLHKGMQDAIRSRAADDGLLALEHGSPVRAVEKRLGELMIEDRHRFTNITWTEFRDLIWRCYDEWAATCV